MRHFGAEYEVRIEVLGRQQGHHNMFHFWASSPERAKEKGQKIGRVVGVSKVDALKGLTDIEQMKLKQMPRQDKGLYIGGGLYDNTLNLDELLGLRRAKRLEENKKKDKTDY